MVYFFIFLFYYIFSLLFMAGYMYKSTEIKWWEIIFILVTCWFLMPIALGLKCGE